MFHPVFGSDIHLRLVDSMHAGTNFQLPGHKTLGVAQAPKIAEHHAHINAKGAIGTAAIAAGAFSPGCIHGHVHKGIVHPALSSDQFTQSRLYLIRRHLFGVFFIGQIKKAAVGTHAAMGTNFQPGL